MKSHRGLASSLLCAERTAVLRTFGRWQPRTAPDSGFKPAPWLRLGAEVRSRTEAASGINFEADHNHLDLLSRVRLSAEVKALDWLKFDVEFQDARTLAGRDIDLYQAQQIRRTYATLSRILAARPGTDGHCVWAASRFPSATSG